MTTTDEQVMNHFPTAAALICATHDRDIEAVHTLLGVLDLAALRSLVVLLADMVPDDRRPTELLRDRVKDADEPVIDRTIPKRREDWTPEALRAAHTAFGHHRDRTPWATLGEREYQRRRGERRREMDRLNRKALSIRQQKQGAA